MSAFFGEPIVDWTPITAQYLGFLRPSEGINFLPQGAFMCSWVELQRERERESERGREGEREGGREREGGERGASGMRSEVG